MRTSGGGCAGGAAGVPQGCAVRDARVGCWSAGRDDHSSVGAGPSPVALGGSVHGGAGYAEKLGHLGGAVLAAGMTRSAFVRQAALSSAGGKVLDVARMRRSVDEAERQLSAAREALG